MKKDRGRIISFSTLVALFLATCSAIPSYADSERTSLENFSHNVSQLHVGAMIDITTVNAGKVVIKIAKIGTDYVDGYVSGANIQEDEWWTTRYYFKSLKTIDSFIVPTDVLPDPVIQADKEEIAEDDNSVYIKDFNHKVSQLQVGAVIEIITVNAGKVELEIANIGTDYIDGYVSGANLQEDEWWTTRYYYTDIKAIDVPVVSTYTLPEPVVQADKTEISENVDSYLVGRNVEITTVSGETIRMKVLESTKKSIYGVMDWNNPMLAVNSEVSRGQIAEIKIYTQPENTRGNKVASGVAKGVGFVLLVTLRILGPFLIILVMA